MSDKDTRIPVSVETREELKQRGNKGDTYDDIIQELLEESQPE